MKNKNPLMEYIQWFFSKYQEIYQQVAPSTDAFRIIDIKKSENGETVIKAQVIGKAMVFDVDPKQVMNNDKLLEGFSKKDVRTITYLAINNTTKKPKYKILVQDFCEKLHQIIFKVGRPGENIALEKTANEISQDKALLNTLDAEDAHMVGYTAAVELAAKEKEALDSIKERINR